MTLPQSAIAEAAPSPIFVSVKQAAEMLNISAWSCYQLCDAKQLDSQYMGRRRLVRYASVQAYADALPTERPSAS